MKHRYSGYSLIEVLVCLAILGIAAALSGNFSHALSQAKADQAIEGIRALASFARSAAITRGVPVTLCGSANGSACGKVWDNGEVLVFIDANRNGSYELAIDEILRRQIFEHHVVWRGSNSNFMRFHPGGYLSSWGRYTYCGETHAGRQLVFNRLGRSYETEGSATQCPTTAS